MLAISCKTEWLLEFSIGYCMLRHCFIRKNRDEIDELVPDDFYSYKKNVVQYLLQIEYSSDAWSANNPCQFEYRYRQTQVEKITELFPRVQETIKGHWITSYGWFQVLYYRSQMKPISRPSEKSKEKQYRRAALWTYLFWQKGYEMSDTEVFITAKLHKPTAGQDRFIPGLEEHSIRSVEIVDLLKSIASIDQQKNLPASSSKCQHCSYAMSLRSVFSVLNYF